MQLPVSIITMSEILFLKCDLYQEICILKICFDVVINSGNYLANYIETFMYKNLSSTNDNFAINNSSSFILFEIHFFSIFIKNKLIGVLYCILLFFPNLQKDIF